MKETNLRILLWFVSENLGLRPASVSEMAHESLCQLLVLSESRFSHLQLEDKNICPPYLID